MSHLAALSFRETGLGAVAFSRTWVAPQVSLWYLFSMSQRVIFRPAPVKHEYQMAEFDLSEPLANENPEQPLSESERLRAGLAEAAALGNDGWELQWPPMQVGSKVHICLKRTLLPVTPGTPIFGANGNSTQPSRGL